MTTVEQGRRMPEQNQQELLARRQVITGNIDLISSWEERGIVFVHTLVQEGMLDLEGLSSWERLHEIYRRHQRPFPHHLGVAGKVALEALITTVDRELSGEAGLCRRYDMLGKDQGDEWFADPSFRRERGYVTFSTKRSYQMRQKWADPAFAKERKQGITDALSNTAVVRSRVLPLAFREGSQREIERLTGLGFEQVRNVLYSARRAGLLRGITDEERTEIHRKGGKTTAHIRWRTEDPDALRPEAHKSIALARRFLEEGLVGGDLSSWERLNQLYERYDRILPPNLSDRLIFETFLIVLEALEKRDGGPLAKYREFGDAVDPSLRKRFALDETFIAEAIRKQVELLLAIFDQDLSLVPTDARDREFLIKFHAARKAAVAGDSTMLSSLSQSYAESDPEIFQRVAKQMKQILQKTPVTNRNIPVQESVVHGEVKRGEMFGPW